MSFGADGGAGLDFKQSGESGLGEYEYRLPPSRPELIKGVRCVVANHGDHRLGWIRLGYGEMSEEFRVRSDHLESLHFCAHQ